jgi:hypothetical protein
MRAKGDPIKQKMKLKQVAAKWDSPRTKDYIESTRKM